MLISVRTTGLPQRYRCGIRFTPQEEQHTVTQEQFDVLSADSQLKIKVLDEPDAPEPTAAPAPAKPKRR